MLQGENKLNNYKKKKKTSQASRTSIARFYNSIISCAAVLGPTMRQNCSIAPNTMSPIHWLQDDNDAAS